MQAVSSGFRGEAVGPNTLQKVLGNDWYRLHPAIQVRFAREPASGEPIVYQGVMEKVHASAAGRLFAHLTWLVGRPLAPFSGRDIPMRISLNKRPDGGVEWQRQYHFPNRQPFLVTSTKRADARGSLCEYAGLGFGMRLKVFVRQGVLHFVSECYFWQVAGRQIPLPDWLSPGRAHVVHEDLGGGRFRFTLSMDHVWFGRTIYQTGVFH